MALTTIYNTSTLDGTMDGSSILMTSNTTEVNVVSELTIVKTASKSYWVEGLMTYTITVTNAEGNPDFTAGVFRDTLDDNTTLNTDTNPVQVNGSTAIYSYSDQALAINNLPVLQGGESFTITFDVELVCTD